MDRDGAERDRDDRIDLQRRTIPTARAPQAILLGVQPGTATSWTLPIRRGNLARCDRDGAVAAVDPTRSASRSLPPALLFAINLGDTTPDTISTDLTLSGAVAPDHRSTSAAPGRAGQSGGPDMPSLTIWTRLEPRCRTRT